MTHDFGFFYLITKSAPSHRVYLVGHSSPTNMVPPAVPNFPFNLTTAYIAPYSLYYYCQDGADLWLNSGDLVAGAIVAAPVQLCPVGMRVRDHLVYPPEFVRPGRPPASTAESLDWLQQAVNYNNQQGPGDVIMVKQYYVRLSDILFTLKQHMRAYAEVHCLICRA